MKLETELCETQQVPVRNVLSGLRDPTDRDWPYLVSYYSLFRNELLSS